MAQNGKLSPNELESIPGGKLRRDAARAWNAPGGPASHGLRPTGPRSSYRTYAEQVELYDLYRSGRGALAADPGTSNHGWGTAMDIPYAWEQTWLHRHGAKYGWKKTEAWSEPWHFNFVGGVGPFPQFKTLKHGSKGKRVVRFTRRLHFIRNKAYPKGYVRRWYWKYEVPVVKGVESFQRDHGLKVDGEIGPKTAAKINQVFKKQYKNRHK